MFCSTKDIPMNKHTIAGLLPPLILLTMIQLTGCAGTSTSDADRSQQDSPEMGSKGGGMRQGPPQGGRDKQSDSKEEPAPPEEAFTACIGKQVGDYVQFTDQKGELLKATCQDYNDHLVAVPEGLEKKGIHR
jgi:hypothetical protein